jgi:hypothetical protein
MKNMYGNQNKLKKGSKRIGRKLAKNTKEA